MLRTRLLLLGALCLLALGAGFLFASGSDAASASSAQNPVQRTFVSTSGVDTNPCTPTQPCRSFAAALTMTTAGGEVIALGSGGYGPFTIDKAITVLGAPAPTPRSASSAGTESPSTPPAPTRSCSATCT